MTTIPGIGEPAGRAVTGARAASAAAWIAGAGLAAVVLSFLVLAAVPPVSRDALTHHLLVPKLWLRHGALVELPHIRFSYYPMNLDLLYLIPLYFGSDIVPKYIHMAFGLMTAALIHQYLRRRLERPFGLLGALIFLSLPVVVQLSITAYVDLGLAFFSLAALMGLLRWFRSGFRPPWLVASGVCCGLALGTKYNGLPVLLLTAAAVVYLYDGRRPAGRGKILRGLGWAAVYGAVALAVFSPWMVRNLLWKGRPFYPLKVPVISRLFSDAAAVPSSAKAPGRSRPGPVSHFAYRHFAFGESWWEIAAIPVRIFFQGEDDDPKHFDGRLNPCLFFFPLAAMAFVRRRSAAEARERLVLGGFSLFYLLFAFFSIDMRIRYLTPVFAPLTILCVQGLRDLSAVASGAGGRPGLAAAPTVLLVALLVPNGAYLAGQFARVRPLDRLSGRVSREAYIERYRPEYAAFRFANEHLADDARILAVFLGNRLYYSDRWIEENDGLFNALVRESASEVELAHHLTERGYTHLLLSHDFFQRWTAENAPPVAQERIIDFFRHQTIPLFAGNGYGLYTLTEPGADP